jgi:hypothetical protein
LKVHIKIYEISQTNIAKIPKSDQSRNTSRN